VWVGRARGGGWWGAGGWGAPVRRRRRFATVGRPNVGKSSLFNRLVGRRQALVRDVPGVTRDRLYGRVEFERWQATVIDTGGVDPSSLEPPVEGVRRPGLAAPGQAAIILFVLHPREGATALDAEIAPILPPAGRPVGDVRWCSSPTRSTRAGRKGRSPSCIASASASRCRSPPSTAAAWPRCSNVSASSHRRRKNRDGPSRVRASPSSAGPTSASPRW